MRRSRRGGYSLIELLLVVMIVGVVAAIAIPRMSLGAGGAAEAALKGNLAVLRSAIEAYRRDHGDQPPPTGSRSS